MTVNKGYQTAIMYYYIEFVNKYIRNYLLVIIGNKRYLFIYENRSFNMNLDLQNLLELMKIISEHNESPVRVEKTCYKRIIPKMELSLILFSLAVQL
jgi:hypothetical protein